MIVWNKHWEWELESIWGLINKIEYANQINDREFKNEFKLGKSMSLLQDIKMFNLDAFKLDYNKINNLVDIDLIEKQKRSIVEILYPFNLNSFLTSDNWAKYISNRWFNDYLCFCPECMKLGYHSLNHQFRFNKNKCFIHKIPLVNCCPKCGKQIPYGLSSSLRAPYSCECGYKLFDMPFEEAYNTWLNPLKIKKHKRVDLEGPGILIIKPASQYQQSIINEGIINKVSNICCNQKSKGNYNFIIQNNDKITPCYNVNDILGNSCTDIDFVYWKAIQAAERHIRRSMRLKIVKYIHNIACARLNIANYSTETIAYFLLVKYAEGVTSLNLIHSAYMMLRRPHSYNGRCSEWGPKHILNELAYLDILHSKYSKDIEMFIYHNIIYRLFILRLLQTFNLILEQVKKDYKEAKYVNINDYYNNFRSDIEDPTSYILDIKNDCGRLWCV